MRLTTTQVSLIAAAIALAVLGRLAAYVSDPDTRPAARRPPPAMWWRRRRPVRGRRLGSREGGSAAGGRSASAPENQAEATASG